MTHCALDRPNWNCYGTLFGFGNSLPQTASAASRCAPAASAQSDVVGVMQNLFAALRADDLNRFQEITHPTSMPTTPACALRVRPDGFRQERSRKRQAL